MGNLLALGNVKHEREARIKAEQQSSEDREARTKAEQQSSEDREARVKAEQTSKLDRTSKIRAEQELERLVAQRQQSAFVALLTKPQCSVEVCFSDPCVY